MNSIEVTYSDIKNAQKAYEDQKIALTMFQNMKRRFYAGRRRGEGNISREAKSLTAAVEQNLTSEKNLRYLSNSIHAERLRTGSAGELADYVPLPGRNKNISRTRQAQPRTLRPLPHKIFPRAPAADPSPSPGPSPRHAVLGGAAQSCS